MHDNNHLHVSFDRSEPGGIESCLELPPERSSTIAVLFACRGSVYNSFPGLQVFDLERDALTWPGGTPAFYHPPCATWGRLKAQANGTEEEHELSRWAISNVRRWGGVVEHPDGSSLFREMHCGKPEGLPDPWGGRLIRVDQFDWGHLARKRTLLYVVGGEIPPVTRRRGRPAYSLCSKVKERELPKHLRERTPYMFACFLLEIAQSVSKGKEGM